MIYKTVQALEQAKNEWQERLGLVEWTIHIRFCSKDDGLEANGDCVYYPGKLLAYVRIGLEGEFAGLNRREYDLDMEVTLVHELLHCCFWANKVEADSVDDVLFEQAIDRLAVAIVKLKRG